MQPQFADPVSKIPPELVLEHLIAVLRSPEFADSPRLSRFLKYVVEQTIEGHAGHLKEYRVGVDVFDRPTDYDPKTDPVVRVEARQLRFRLAAYYSARGHRDEVVISIPKGGYGAHFERTAPVEIPLETVQPVVSLPPARSRGFWIGLGALAMAVLTGAGVLAWRASGPAPQPSIAVLPFSNLGANPAYEYFSDGLTDEITEGLARLNTLRVIARGSAFQFKGKQVDIREAGRQLSVTSLLEGRVSRQGDRVKIFVQLERVSDGSVIWSQTYERRLADVFAVQTEVASRIASDLRVPVAGRAVPRPITRDPEAQDHYLRARFEAERMNGDALTRAVGEYQQALDRDPGYAAAWYGLAVARHRGINVRNLDRSEVAAIGSGYRKALDLDSGLADAHAGLALMAMQFDWDWPRAEQELKAALALGPTAIAEGHYAVYLMTRGRLSEAENHLRRALDLDPLGSAVLLNSAVFQFYAGRFASARREWERHPEIFSARCMAAYALLLEGRPEEAMDRLPALRKTAPSSALPQITLVEAIGQARMGNRASALELISGVEGQSQRTGVALYWMALARASVNDDSAALQWLEKSVAAHENYLMFMGLDPAFIHLRTLPAFRALKVRVGLPE
jgi:serine/threonine-protein kinase